MKLIPLVKGMKLYCRRVINIGGRKYIEGEELPYKQLSLSWRMVLRLYEQRRVISESDPYFQELMETYGRGNNPDFAKKWLKDNGVVETKKKPKSKKSKSRRKTKVQKTIDAKKKAEKAVAEKAEDERNPERIRRSYVNNN